MKCMDCKLNQPPLATLFFPRTLLIVARSLHFSAIIHTTSGNFVFRWLEPLPTLRFKTLVLLAIQNMCQKWKLQWHVKKHFQKCWKILGVLAICRITLKNNFIYLFLAVLSLRCRAGFSPAEVSGASPPGCMWASHRGVSLVAEHRPAGTWASVGAAWGSGLAPGLQSSGWGVAVHGPSCSLAYGIFLDQGSNLCLLYWQLDSLPLSHQGGPRIVFKRH